VLWDGYNVLMSKIKKNLKKTIEKHFWKASCTTILNTHLVGMGKVKIGSR
jgi:hypothetical protein